MALIVGATFWSLIIQRSLLQIAPTQERITTVRERGPSVAVKFGARPLVSNTPSLSMSHVVLVQRTQVGGFADVDSARVVPSFTACRPPMFVCTDGASMRHATWLALRAP